MSRTGQWLFVSALFIGAALAHGERLLVAGALVSTVAALILFLKRGQVTNQQGDDDDD